MRIKKTINWVNELIQYQNLRTNLITYLFLKNVSLCHNSAPNQFGWGTEGQWVVVTKSNYICLLYSRY